MSGTTQQGRQTLTERPLVGISACLLGEAVRYDGGHKRSPLCADELATWLAFEPLCPELGVGLGVPRPPIRLVGEGEQARARGVQDAGLDVSAALRAYAQLQAERLPALCGYVFIAGSPSCGLYSVKQYGVDGRLLNASGRGLYARELSVRLPWLPVEEEGRLADPLLLENFVSRVFAVQRWHELRHTRLSAQALTTFHARFKYSLMAQNAEAYTALGRLLADLRGRDLDSLAADYFPALMRALALPAQRGGHVNALLHLQGYLRGAAPPEARRALAARIEDYRLGRVALAAPVELMQQLFARHPHPYVARQHYLFGYPSGLRLRAAL